MPICTRILIIVPLPSYYEEFSANFRVSSPYTVGDVTISGGMIFAMSSDDEFTLTCISTGGPATTVTWTRDMEVITEGNMTVFDTDTANTTAEYTHTLTGNTAGEYTCTVTNSISSDSAILTVQGESLWGFCAPQK